MRECWRIIEHMSGTVWAGAAERLRAAVQDRVEAEIAEAVAIADLAAEHEWAADARIDVVGKRAVRIGGDGTALVDEFLPLEVAALQGVSVSAATWLIRDIVNLAGRFPLVWFQVKQGLLPVFRARQLVQEIDTFDLTLDQARELDALLALKLPGLAWGRLLKLARGLIAQVAAPAIEQRAHEARAARFVRKLPTEDPLVAYLSCRVDTRDAIFFDAQVDRIADLLAAHGDTDPKEVLRAKAVGILATPARAQLMLQEAAGVVGTIRATDPRLVPAATVYVHVAEETLLTGHGTCRVEGVGPLSATLLSVLLGHERITLAPVIRPYAQISVDSYEIPDRIRRQILLRDSVEVFPWSSRSPRTSQLDHTRPWRPGVKNQTRASNLGPLSTRPHRGKTHGNWQLEQPRPGIFWWTSPTGHRYRVGPHGTTPMFRHEKFQHGDQIQWDTDHKHKPPPPDGGDPQP